MDERGEITKRERIDGFARHGKSGTNLAAEASWYVNKVDGGPGRVDLITRVDTRFEGRNPRGISRRLRM